MQGVHITAQEPEIAQILIENRLMHYNVCINVIDIRTQYFWKVRDLVHYEHISCTIRTYNVCSEGYCSACVIVCIVDLG